MGAGRGIGSMRTENGYRQAAFGELPRGGAFRFYFRDEPAIALKAFFPGGGDAALVLTSTGAGLRPGDLLSAHDVGSPVVALDDVSLVPSAESATNGCGHFAECGEIELQGDVLIFVTQLQAGQRFRVNLKSGAIRQATGAPPAEIYSKWSVVRTADGETLYTYEPAPPVDDVTVVVDI